MDRLALLATMGVFLLGACDHKNESEGANSSTPEVKTSERPTAAIVQKPQASLAQIFSAATTVLSSTKTAEEFAEIKPYKDVTLSVEPNGLKITSTGIDPAILLPAFRGEHAIVEIIIESPAPTTLQLFYRLPGMANFNESSSIRVPTKAGRNIVYAEIPAWIGVLRLDPGQLAGDYLLESCQVKGLAP